MTIKLPNYDLYDYQLILTNEGFAVGGWIEIRLVNESGVSLAATELHIDELLPAIAAFYEAQKYARERDKYRRDFSIDTD